ncbi:bromodomain containing 1 [Homo sapiens]|uniref:Bromodomain-containing protein 1 n=3 Tax=Homo sapiens TaxID=9606 RepID=BRD1_HUMAN|nr:bromodomain-containing protein 1 isoform 2 [Homo sapiens]NP_001381480.1 bromodomain-containing protein 1 isoform 2 [Homo sapiens]NP_001381481.1 bromodomain-containing protein 1 isoform 2 [Homo sapiens]O95696.1 RecName: Full=Bromodomain-containing protein 1; AltName: Full=BR140-like protein; AltName: Full=Bromodomain and PHD finger-containing protein 2 [Homo sapiens]CAK54399.1 BRD1 [synthetic construct]AAF34320.1 BRL [Homo sapiens]EAW73474.1 bromodomain containing 1, isoform CRA_b [Homo sap|eukprot:NP_001291738.1 bromodomain-containing protein 1 isoform 2 [Homo sapiens]
MRRKGRCHRGSAARHPSSPCSVKHSPTRETLTYAQAQRMVEIEIEGRLHRISIFDPLEIILEDDLTAQEMSECNSNKENSERPPVCLRTKRHKNNRVKKKNEALPSAHGTPASASALPEPKVRIVEYSPPSAPRRPPVYYKFIEKSAEELDNEVEYDMDEEDYAWLEIVNEKRKGDCVPAVSQSMFEFLMDRFEKESHCENQKQGEQQSLIDEDAVCCICMDGECQNSNVILFCDMCNLAVHQECYGVPYIPEGQWLCRHCLQSRARPADCVLCPNKGGAFKKTDDDRWGHVVCALWIPEVGFANTVFIEPIDGVRNIPPARWKLTCYLCKQKGVGACIQCHKANCYTAFHVTCAQKAGLYMKMEPVKELTGGGTTFSVRKTAYCDVHTPPGCTRRPLNIYGDVEMKNGVCRKESSVKTVRSTSKVRKKAKKAKKALAEPCAVLPTVCAPYIPPQRLNRIANQVAIQRKKQFVERAHSYWLLKRLSRNGAPLLRRLQSSLQSQRSSQQRENDEEMKAAKEKLKYWQRLRHDLERARLLIELLRKREKLKREQVKVEQVAMELRLTPLTVLLRSVLDQLQDKDPARIFAQPVSLKEVPDYLDHIKHPMDFATMRKRLEAQGYKNLHEFEEDFDLIIDNCMKYNARDTVFYRAAVRLRDQGGVVLRQARREVDSIGLEEASGMHLPERPAAAPRRPFSWEDVDRLLDPANRAHLGLEEQLRELLDMLDLTCAMKSSGSRSKRAKLLKKEIALLRNKLSQQHSQPLPTGPGLEGFEEDGAALGPEAGEEVLPRLETLLQPRKRSRSTCGDSEVEEESPGKRLDAGLTNGFGGARSEQEPGGGLGRKATPRRRCASESSISSSNSPLCDSSFNAPKCGRGKPALVRRHTLEDRSELISCIENGNYAKAARIAAEVGQSSMWISTDAAASVLEPLKVVWAKCSGYPSYPALIIDPKMPRVPGHHNGVTIPAPPLDVLKIGEHMQTKSDEKLFLVLFFDNKRSWQWLPKSKMVPLGIDETIDKLKMMEGRNSSIRKAVRIAFDRAMNHLSRVHGEPTSDLSDID